MIASHRLTIPKCHIHPCNSLQDVKQNHWTMEYRSWWQHIMRSLKHIMCSIWQTTWKCLGSKWNQAWHKAVALPTLLYACEIWTVYPHHAERLNDFHLSCLRKLLKVRWQEEIPDTEILMRAGMHSLNVTRMSDEWLPKKVFYGELQVGKRSQGGQKKCYKGTIKASLIDFNIPPESWEHSAQDRAKWHGLIRKGADECDTKGICEAERKGKKRAPWAQHQCQWINIRNVILRIDMFYLQQAV